MFGAGVSAADVFTWTDSSGVIHFSQWAPDDVHDVSRLVVHATNRPGYDPQDDPYSIANQAERTNATWKELEARKLERREKLRKEREQLAQNAAPHYDRHYPYSRPVSYWPIYRPIYPPIRPPVHPPDYRPVPLPNQPAAPVKYSPDPMRSAHIGVRSSAAPNAPMRIE